jgi:hypothetical protein
MRYALTILFVFIVTNASPQKYIGNYVSNFAEFGFFMTQLKLDKDSTFICINSGDMTYFRDKGRYSVKNNRLILQFEPRIDTLGFMNDTTILSLDPRIINVIKKPIIEIYDNKDRVNEYVIRKNKLLSVRKNGTISRRAKGVKKHKKYIFWGDKGMGYRRHYLKKVSDNDFSHTRAPGIYLVR